MILVLAIWAVALARFQIGSIGDINDGIQFNNSGFYRRKYTFLSNECIMFYYFQESTPPIFPNGRADWDKIKKGSEEFDVESAITSRFESRKEQEFDSIDRNLAARTRNNNNKKLMTLEIMTRSILKGKGELTQITVTQMIQRGLNDKSSLTLTNKKIICDYTASFYLLPFLFSSFYLKLQWFQVKEHIFHKVLH
jgi:hypothetical protein